MTECTNETLRDLLPALARHALPVAEASRVRSHLEACAACAAEWEILQAAGALFTAATPAVDVAAIVSRLPAPPTGPALRVARGGSGGGPARWRPSRSFFAAAASLTLVATLSLTVLRPIFFAVAPGAPSGVAVDGAPDTAPVVAAGPAATTPVSAALVGGADLAELGVDALSTLLAELEQMEATIAEEPTTWREPVAEIPGGL